jgi:ribosomal protein L7Ae-like RNA K-turn-binding protein
VSPESSVYKLLGLARRAGAVAPGTAAVRRAIQGGQARLVLLAGDASDVQMEKIRKSLRTKTIPQARLGDRISLGAAIGLAPISAVAVTNAPLADQVLAELDEVVVVGAAGAED